MEKTFYEIQNEILDQKTASSVFDQQIDIHQEEATNNLKRLILDNHFLLQRLLITDLYRRKHIKSPLNYPAFFSTEKDVFANFASLDIPEHISKGPMKAFLNNFFDDLNSFLPNFYKLDFSFFPKSSLQINPVMLLLRCVFPSIFAYCWSEEASLAYGHNIALWFNGIYREKPDILKFFDSHWISQAIYGYFSSLDIYPFINAAIRPLFFDFISLYTNDDPNTLVDYAIKILESIEDNFHLLPDCLNTFFLDLMEAIPDEDPKNTLIRYTFFDSLIAPLFYDPILSSVSDVSLPYEDYKNFSSIYTVFRAKFAACSDQEKPLAEGILSVPEFASFNPIGTIKKCIYEKKASMKLPSLQHFCDIVQCAHQPIIMTTHYLALLFKFAECLQSAKVLPKSLERPLGTIVQESIADQLENLPDHLFWFPCFALNYVNVPPVSFIKESKTTPLYKLLSSTFLRISPYDTDFINALENAGDAATLTTHPDLRTEVQWLLKNKSLDSFLHITEEISIKQEEIDKKRKRSLDLLSLAQIFMEKYAEIPNGAQRALAMSLLPDFETYSNNKIQSSHFMINIKQRIKDFSGNAFPIIGSYIAEAILVEVTPRVREKNEHYRQSFTSEDELSNNLKQLVTQITLTSSLYSIAAKLIPVFKAINEYGELVVIDNAIELAFSSHFLPNVVKLASDILSLLIPLPTELLALVFTDQERELLKLFTNTFARK